MLPAGITVLVAGGVTAYVLAKNGVGPQRGFPLWGVLAGALLLVCVVLVGAALYAGAEARRTTGRHLALARAAAQSRSEVRALLRRLEQGERPQPRAHPALTEPTGDSLDMLAHELTLAQRSAEAAVTEAAALVRAGSSGSDEKVEVFVNLARRLQSLVHREIELLDELENEVEDPDLLKGLFHVDHLATRIRRHAENLAVLGGAVSRRQWTRPVTTTEVLRSAIAEVEQYSRVKLVPPIEGTLRGHAVADVIHLLAELVENATVFSAPQTQVLLRVQHVTAGLAVEVEDRGLGMTNTEQTRMNALLSDPEQFDVGELLSDGRIGLFVVASLARRHGIVVQLQSNIYGGIQAVLVLPRAVLGEDAAPVASSSPAPAPAPPQHAISQPLPPEGAAPAPTPAPPASAGALPAVPAPSTSAPSGPVPSLPAQTGTANGLPKRTSPSAARRGPDAADRRPQAAGGAVRTPQAGAHAPAGGGRHSSMADGRPELPRRRRQEHLVPELREPPRPRPETDEPEAGHDPGLMAAFRRGTSLAEGTGETDETSPA